MQISFISSLSQRDTSKCVCFGVPPILGLVQHIVCCGKIAAIKCAAARMQDVLTTADIE